MLTINLQDKKYPLPEELTPSQWQTVMSWDFEDPKHYAHIVNAVTHAPIDLLKEVEPENLVLPVAFIIQLLNERQTVEGTKPFDQILFGEFIDLDVYLNMGIEKHLEDIAEVLAPGKKINAAQACQLADEFSNFRIHIFRQYKVLFGLDDKDFEGSDEDAEIDRMQIARAWYRTIVELADWDLLKIDQVVDQPLKKTLNFMALRKQAQLEENEKELNKKRQYDLQANRR